MSEKTAKNTQTTENQPIKFLEPETIKSIYLDGETGLFEEPLVLNNDKIFYVSWTYTEIWNKDNAATYEQPAEYSLEEQSVEITNVSDVEGNLEILTEEVEKEIETFLKELNYAN